MNNKNNLKISANVTTHRHGGGVSRPWLAALLHRWPTCLAVVMAALLAPGSTVEELSGALPLLALGYLAASVLQRRQATWLLAIVIVAAFAALRLQNWVEPIVALLVVAVLLVLWAAVRGQLRQDKMLVLEIAGMVGFTVIAMAAVSVEPTLGRYVIAAGWFGHAAWDFFHLKTEKVVSRSFAEWCAVYDVLRAIGILVLPLGHP
jgi:hypothetical protein